MIDRQTIARVLDAAHIEDVIGRDITLKKRGANYLGLCPFHSERTPSFTVSPAKGFFKCFGCGEGGSVVTYITKRDGCTYPEAIRTLAKMYNITIEEREMSEEDMLRESQREKILRIDEFAQKWFEKQLWETNEGQSVGLSYLRSRGIRDDVIRKFSLGYSPHKTTFYYDALKAGFTAEDIQNADLGGVFENEKTDENGEMTKGTKPYDRFRDRVIFPWFNISNKAIAFNGRILTNNKNIAKYVNSREIEGVYSKSRALYGINLAKNAIIRENVCYIVEGQFDVISMHQAGMENVLASSGTSVLSQYHAQQIHRFTSNVVLLFDADKAGIHAIDEKAPILLKEGCHVKVATLPEGDDPDSLSHRMSADEFREYVVGHTVDLIDYKLNQILKDGDLNGSETVEAIHQLSELIALMRDPVERDVFTRMVSERLKQNELVITKEVKQQRIANYQKDKERGGDTGGKNADTDTTVSSNSNRESEETHSHASLHKAEQPQPQTAVLTTSQRRQKAERELIGLILLHGTRPLYQYDDGTVYTVARYVIEEIEKDKFFFSTPVYKNIIELYKAHIEESETEIQMALLSSDDEEVTSTLSELAINKYDRSRIYDNDTNTSSIENMSDDDLSNRTQQLLRDYRITIVEEMIADIANQRQQASIEGRAADAETLYMKQLQLQQYLRTSLQKR